MANSVDTDQTAPLGAVCSGSMLFASILNLSKDICSRRLQQMSFSDAFFLGALRVMCLKNGYQILFYTF